jgi:hypothetical protein
VLRLSCRLYRDRVTDGQAGVGVEEVQVGGVHGQVKPLSWRDVTARRDARGPLRLPTGQGDR